MTEKDFKEIEEKIGYTFEKKYLLKQAFTRKTYAEENLNTSDNEKFEFVGDKALDFIIVKKLTCLYGFESEGAVILNTSLKNGDKISATDIATVKNFEFAFSEGEMTEMKKQVVKTSFLAKAIETLGLEKYLLMGNGDIKNNVQNQPHVKEDLLEAIIGAIAIDSCWNINAIENAVDKMLNVEYYIKNGAEEGIDYISNLQNWYVKEYGKNPEYVFYYENDEKFRCYLQLDGYGIEYFDGFGYSKKEAIRLAAKRACEYIQQKEENSNIVLDAIGGKFDLETAVSKLQILLDKKIISGLSYGFTEMKATAKNNGNPTWACSCRINGIDEIIEYADDTKAKAKKYAAYEMLTVLTGRNYIKTLFLKYGKII